MDSGSGGSCGPDPGCTVPWSRVASLHHTAHGDGVRALPSVSYPSTLCEFMVPTYLWMGEAGRASIGQVWTRNLAPTAPAVTAFIAISVLPSVRQTGCLSMRLIVLFPSSLDGARDMAFWSWALVPGQVGFVRLG